MRRSWFRGCQHGPCRCGHRVIRSCRFLRCCKCDDSSYKLTLIRTRQALVDNEIWLDPTLDEAQSVKGSLVLATMPALETVTSVWQNGQMQTADVIKACVSRFSFLCTDRVSVHGTVRRAMYRNAFSCRSSVTRFTEVDSGADGMCVSLSHYIITDLS